MHPSAHGAPNPSTGHFGMVYVVRGSSGIEFFLHPRICQKEVPDGGCVVILKLSFCGSSWGSEVL